MLAHVVPVGVERQEIGQFRRVRGLPLNHRANRQGYLAYHRLAQLGQRRLQPQARFHRQPSHRSHPRHLVPQFTTGSQVGSSIGSN